MSTSFLSGGTYVNHHYSVHELGQDLQPHRKIIYLDIISSPQMVGFISFCSFGCPYKRCSLPLDSIDVCFEPPCPHSHQPLLASDNFDWLSRRQNYKKSSISPSFFLKTLEKVVCLEFNCYLCSEIAGRQGAIARLTITVPAAHTIRTAGGSFYEICTVEQ